MTTRLVYLAQVLRELADDAEAGRLTGLSVVATRAGGDRPQAIVHHPREKTQADAFFGGLVTNAAIILVLAWAIHGESKSWEGY